MRAIPVAVEDVPMAWPTVRGWLITASKKGDGWWTEAEAYKRAIRGHMALWIAADEGGPRGAALCEIEDWPDGSKVCHIALFGGNGLDGLTPCVAAIERWAKASGAKCVEIRGRLGMKKAMKRHGYAPRLVTLRKGL